MTTFAGPPVFPPYFLDEDGDPGAQASITVYLRGTTTKATVYTDRLKTTGGTAAPYNPVIADTLGNAPFFCEPGEYDALVNGVTFPFTVLPDFEEPTIPPGTYVEKPVGVVKGDLLAGSGAGAIARLAVAPTQAYMLHRDTSGALEWALAVRFGRALNAKDYAVTEAQRQAAGNGVTKPLSGYYADLAAAQVDYPHATALTDELDWAISQAAVTAAQSSVGVVFIPGAIWMTGNKSITNTTAVVISGAGGDRTRVITTSTTLDGVFVINAARTTLRAMEIRGPGATATAGSGVKITGGGSGRGFCVLEDLFINGFFDNVNAEMASNTTYRGCYSVNPVRYGFWLRNTVAPDSGDQIVVGCTFDSSAASSVAAIRMESAGGLKMTASKLLRHQYAVDVQIADGVATSVLVVSGNSIEGTTVACFRLGQLGTTGTFTRSVITGNQLNAGTAAALINGAGSDNVTFTGNTIYSSSSDFVVKFNGGAGGVVQGNDFSVAPKCIQLNVGCSHIDVGQNSYSAGSNIVTIEDNTAFNTVNPGVLLHKYRRRLAGVTSTTVNTTLVQLDIANYRAATVELTLEALLGGVGPASRYIRKLLSKATGTVTVANVLDVAGGSVVDIDFDVTTTSGSVIIGVKRNSGAGGVDLTGNVTVAVDGHVVRATLL